MAEKRTAVMLPVEEAGSLEAQAISGFHGSWIPGQLYAIETLRMSRKQLQGLIDERNLPLLIVSTTEPVAEEFVRPGSDHVPSGLIRPEVERLAAAEEGAADVVFNDAGQVVAQSVTPAPDTAAAWVKPTLERNLALSEGRFDDVYVEPRSVMSPEVDGPLIRESPDMVLPVDAQLDLAEDETVDELKGMKKDELLALAVERGIEGAEGMKADELKDALIDQRLDHVEDLAALDPAAEVASG